LSPAAGGDIVRAMTRWNRRATFVVRLASVLLALVLQAGALGAQEAASSVIRGRVRTPNGAPIANANVFVLETLDGVLTAEDGAFGISTTIPGDVTLVVKRVGFEPFQRVVRSAERDSMDVVLTPSPVRIAGITVQAGSYTASEERTATLTPLEVVTTPGTAADVNRAIQSLPGVQAVDEGTALFVRGGDYAETKVFLDDALMLNPIQLLTPTGTFVGTVDPFLLDGIFFSSGGFGARYGDALSGVAGLRTRGRVDTPGGTVSAGLAAISADLALPLGGGVSLRAAGNRLDMRPYFRLNNSTRSFAPPPNGRDLSGSLSWKYRSTGELKLFVIDQTTDLAVAVEEASFTGRFSSDVRPALAVLTWNDVAGVVSTSVSASRARLDREQGYGAFRLDAQTEHRQVFASAAWEVVPGLTWKIGGEVERTGSEIRGSIPSRDDPRPGARVTVLDFDRTGNRVGAFTELDWNAGRGWRLIPGVRADRSTLTNRRTFDPRLSIAWRGPAGATFTGAWGLYHQVADPLFYDDSIGIPDLPSMRAEQRVVGVQMGEGPLQLRLEVYDKRYHDLAQQSRENRAVGGGEGTARGVDFFFKGVGPFGTTTRSIVSHVRSRRTDPNTGVLARSEFDITWTQTHIIERMWGTGVRLAVAYRDASGRPFTPVIGASFDAERDVWTPEYGAPTSERLPTFRRVDVSWSYFRPLSATLRSVVFVSVNNVFDRENVQSYRYTSDYGRRIPVRSIFNRGVYFGFTLIRQ
jgi:hypothetical protein